MDSSSAFSMRYVKRNGHRTRLVCFTMPKRPLFVLSRTIKNGNAFFFLRWFSFFICPSHFQGNERHFFHFSAIDLTYYRVLYVFYGELFHLAVFKTDRLNWIAAATAATVNWHHMLGIGHSEWLQCFMIIVAVLNFVYFHIFLMNFHVWVWLDFLKFRSRITSLRISVSK